MAISQTSGLNGGDIYYELLMALYGINTVLDSNIVSIRELFSAADLTLLDKILQVSNEYMKIKSYITEQEDTEDVYAAAFIENVDEVLEPYRQDIVQLEHEMINNKQQCLSFVWSKIERYSELFRCLNSLIYEINIQKSSGCLLLQHLHICLSSHVGVFKTAVSHLIRGVNIVLFQQLTEWLLYGELIDDKNKFIIKKTTSTEENVLYRTFEEFVINENMLPSHIELSCAEKVLKTGQIVLILRMNPKNKITSSSYKIGIENEILQKKEKYFLNKLQQVQNMIVWNDNGAFDRVVMEISTCVTSVLLNLAMNEAQLIKQLHLVKDLYLQGRGELFHEFINEISKLNKLKLHQLDLNLVLQESARKVLLGEEYLQGFTMEVKKQKDDSGSKIGWVVNLKYDVPWPLQLLFTPTVLASYNNMFQFLFRLKRMQICLKNKWLSNKSFRHKRSDAGQDQLHHNLLFLLNNLQYYIQVDVLDSQFMTLESSVSRCSNFDNILTAHNVFLANIISQSFIPNESSSSDIHSSSTIYAMLNNVLVLCEEYLHTSDEQQVDLKQYQARFDGNVEYLLKMLTSITKQSIHPGSKYLSQFLLRIDFNSFFSQQHEQNMSVIYC